MAFCLTHSYYRSISLSHMKPRRESTGSAPLRWGKQAGEIGQCKLEETTAYNRGVRKNLGFVAEELGIPFF